MTTPLASPQAAVDRSQAEALLSDLATKLLRLPFEQRTQALHIRALELKRRIGTWGPTLPTHEELRVMHASIVALRSETEHWRGILRAG